MGRELRRVPADWVHPRDWQGHLKPLFDKDFATEARDWLDQAIAWDNGTHADLQGHPERKEQSPFFQQWDGGCPEPDAYRPAWPEESRTHFQVYETVTEGTPISPVFATTEEVVDWLIEQGYSDLAARGFVAEGWAPSMVIAAGRLYRDIESSAL